jgi:oligogalacturonide transport system substrate-binding protein
MKRRKTVIGLLSTCLVIGSILAGCGNSNSNSAAEENSGATEPKVTLRFSWWGSDNRHEATLKVIEAYKKIKPNVTIEAEYSGFDGYEQKLKTQLSSNSAPDIIQIDQPWMAQLVSRGDVFVNLSEQAALDTSTLDQEFLDTYTVFDGKLLGVPSGVNASILYINKTAADKAGVEFTKNMTWDDAIEQATKLRNSDPNAYLLNYDGKDHGVGSFIGQIVNGNQINDDYTLNFNQEQATKAFDTLEAVLKAGVYQPIGESALFFSKAEQNPKWINEQTFGIIDVISNLKRHSTTLENVEFDVVLAPVVKGSSVGASMIRPSQVFVINSKSKATAEAAEFLNYFINDEEAAKILNDVRGVPASSKALEAAVSVGGIDPLITDALKLAYTSKAPSATLLESNSEIAQIFSDISLEFEFKKLNSQEAAEKLISKLTSKLKELKASAQ